LWRWPTAFPLGEEPLTAFFLTLHTGLAGFAALVISRPVGIPHSERFGLTLTGAVGLILCAAWWLLLRSYRLLNSAKFKVINEIEEGFELRPFSREWERLKQEDPVSRNERNCT
jgi:predicted RND superfamily exporter protein